MEQQQVLINQQIQKERQKFKLSSFFKPKTIFIILCLVILIEIFFAVKSLQEGIPPPPIPPLPITGGSLELNSLKDKYLLGENIPVEVKLETGGNPVEGVDIVLHFDPKKLSLSEDGISTGRIFPSYALVNVNEQKGLVLISGNSGNESFNGGGVMAELKFLAKEAGEAQVRFEFNVNDTKDSNMVDSSGKDILEKVQNLNLDIQ